MSTTTSYGYKKPQTGDRGATFFPDLEFNIDRTNNHSHNGTDSTLLTPLSITKNTTTRVNAWSSVGSGTYRALVTVPSGYTVDAALINFRDYNTGDALALEMVKNASDSFYIYVNDNTLDVRVIYS